MPDGGACSKNNSMNKVSYALGLGIGRQLQDLCGEDLNLEGLDLDDATVDKLLAVDKDLWTKEIAEMRRYYKEDIADKGGKIPEALIKELDKLEERLAK